MLLTCTRVATVPTSSARAGLYMVAHARLRLSVSRSAVPGLPPAPGPCFGPAARTQHSMHRSRLVTSCTSRSSAALALFTESTLLLLRALSGRVPSCRSSNSALWLCTGELEPDLSLSSSLITTEGCCTSLSCAGASILDSIGDELAIGEGD